MTSNALRTPLRTTFERCSFSPPIPPGECEHSPRVGTLGGVRRPESILEIDLGFGAAETASMSGSGPVFLADRPAVARKPGEESQGMSFRARAAISPEAISGPPKPDCGGGTPKTYERKTA